MSAVNIRAVGPDDLDLIARLFGQTRTTRHCWCTAFCSTRWQFATGWYSGGNRQRFHAMAESATDPMGLLAMRASDPIGWCACGPRTRYMTAASGRSRPMLNRPRSEDANVWLIACLLVLPDCRDQGVAVLLLRSAIELARARAASAIEAWPLSNGVRSPGKAHLGREGAFARLGFRPVDQPNPEQVVMRLAILGR